MIRTTRWIKHTGAQLEARGSNRDCLQKCMLIALAGPKWDKIKRTQRIITASYVWRKKTRDFLILFISHLNSFYPVFWTRTHRRPLCSSLSLQRRQVNNFDSESSVRWAVPPCGRWGSDSPLALNGITWGPHVTEPHICPVLCIQFCSLLCVERDRIEKWGDELVEFVLKQLSELSSVISTAALIFLSRKRFSAVCSRMCDFSVTWQFLCFSY